MFACAFRSVSVSVLGMCSWSRSDVAFFLKIRLMDGKKLSGFLWFICLITDCQYSSMDFWNSNFS